MKNNGLFACHLQTYKFPYGSLYPDHQAHETYGLDREASKYRQEAARGSDDEFGKGDSHKKLSL
jgi:hypothetical protein